MNKAYSSFPIFFKTPTGRKVDLKVPKWDRQKQGLHRVLIAFNSMRHDCYGDAIRSGRILKGPFVSSVNSETLLLLMFKSCFCCLMLLKQRTQELTEASGGTYRGSKRQKWYVNAIRTAI